MRAYSRLENTAEFTDAQALALKTVVKNTDTTAEQLARIASEIDEFDSLRYPVQETLARQLAQADEPVDAAQKLNNLDLDGLRRVAVTENAATAADLIRRADGTTAADLLNDLDRTGLQRFFDLDDELHMSLVRTFQDVSDLDGDHIGRMSKLVADGKMDQSEIQRLSDILKNEDTNSLLDESINAGDLLDLSEKTDISNTISIAKRGGDNIVLVEGNIDSGWTHITERHIQGSYRIDDEPTSLFPLGETVKGRELPNTMSEDELQQMIYDSIKQGERHCLVLDNLSWRFSIECLVWPFVVVVVSEAS